MAPEATAQPTASGHDTSGSSGLAGGSLPVAAVHPLVTSILATAAAPTAAPAPRTFHANAPMTTSSSDSAVQSQACNLKPASSSLPRRPVYRHLCNDRGAPHSAESAVRRRPSNLHRLAPAKGVGNLRCALAIHSGVHAPAGMAGVPLPEVSTRIP